MIHTQRFGVGPVDRLSRQLRHTEMAVTKSFGATATANVLTTESACFDHWQAS